MRSLPENATRRRIPSTIPWLVLALLGAIAVANPARATERSDSFLAGYVSATLERELSVPDALQDVRDGVVALRRERVPESQREPIEATIAAIAGVKGVVWIGEEAAPEDASRESSPARAADSEPASETLAVLPPESLFPPLVASPRWPHFSAAQHTYRNEPGLTHVAAVSFGAAIPLVRGDLRGTSWEVGIHSAVFSIFDLDGDSFDLVNSDFWVGIPLAIRYHDLAGLVRLYHQSSHLGDEFLLRNPIDRVNLSYEALDALVSYELLDWMRVYAGAEILVHREPEDMERWSVQAGFEIASPQAFLGERLRPILGLDLTRRQESRWHTDVSLRGGLQIENSRAFGGRRLQLLGEYYRGRNPNGQFWEREIEYVGLGLHLHY